MMKLDLWFPTPIWNIDLRDSISEDQFKLAYNFCVDSSNKVSGVKLSNIGGWQSPQLSLSDIPYTPLNIFIGAIDKNVKIVYNDLSIANKQPILDSLWVNVNKKSDYNMFHSHPRSSLSGVFYLSDNNSDIVFEKDHNMSLYHDLTIGSNLQSPVTQRHVRYTPHKGQLFIFPSWLLHAVDKNETDDIRVSVAFNCTI